MSTALWYGLVWSGGLGMLALPFVPLWREWVRPTDSGPLAVAPEGGSESDFFARRLREEVAATARRSSLPQTHAEWAAATATVIAARELQLEAGTLCRAPIYVEGDFQAGADCVLSAVLATRDIRLGPGSEVSQWIHADGRLRVAAASVLLRRATAERAIHLEPGCSFERLRAPRIAFGRGAGRPRVPHAPSSTAQDFSAIPRAVRRTESLYRVRGTCVLPPGGHFRGSLVVTGALMVGEDTTIYGDIKARGGIVLGARCAIHGAASSETSLEIGRGAFLRGPVIAETDVLIGSGATIGAPGLPTTVSAENIVVESGAVAHGLVWAREAGLVWSGS